MRLATTQSAELTHAPAQLDVCGEVMDTLHLARASGHAPQAHAWQVQCALLTFLDTHWREPDEGTFLPCSFWLADCLEVIGRHAEAEALFERLLALRNDVGLLSEEFDPRSGLQTSR